MSPAVTLRAMLGDYPVTHALRRGTLGSPLIRFEFADVESPASAFPRVVRDLAFDVAELAIVTFLLAKAHGKPLVLLPAVVLGRFQHPFLVGNRERGALTPADLAGRRVGVRSYSVTTGAWVRGILAEDWGVDLDRVRWVTFEDPHVAEFRDPPNVERAPAGRDLMTMLLAGEPTRPHRRRLTNADSRVAPLIVDPVGAAQAQTKQRRSR
jgi:4,5-dihydroxyphthalate decarboxylase